MLCASDYVIIMQDHLLTMVKNLLKGALMEVCIVKNY